MPVLVLLFIVLPILELAVIVAAARTFGTPQALVVLLLVSVVGAWLVKLEGLGVWRRLRATVARGELPHNELVDGVLILVAGVLMLTPGFVTGAVGLFVLFPPTRGLIRAGLMSRFRITQVAAATDAARSYRRGGVVDAESYDISDDTGGAGPGDRGRSPGDEPPSLER